jgi:hypothetical protein
MCTTGHVGWDAVNCMRCCAGDSCPYTDTHTCRPPTRTPRCAAQVSAAAREPWATYLATPAASWLDDFLTWISPEIPQCCRQFSNGTRCPPPDQPPCSADPGACSACSACLAPGQLGPGGRPGEGEFELRLPWFMEATPSAACAKGGAGAYTDAIKVGHGGDWRVDKKGGRYAWGAWGGGDGEPCSVLIHAGDSHIAVQYQVLKVML